MQNLEIPTDVRIQQIRDCITQGDLDVAKFHLELISKAELRRPEIHEIQFCLSYARAAARFADSRPPTS